MIKVGFCVDIPIGTIYVVPDKFHCFRCASNLGRTMLVLGYIQEKGNYQCGNCWHLNTAAELARQIGFISNTIT